MARLWPWLILAVLAYLVLTPLVMLQVTALGGGASGYQRALATPGLSRILLMTVALAVGSVLIALVSGVTLAWMSTRLPRRLEWLSVLPLLMIVLPPVSTVIGWAMLLAPRSGVVNQWLRMLPWWQPAPGTIASGPIDVYSAPWIIIITGLSITSFVYVFLRAGLMNIGNDVIEASRVSGAGSFRTFVSVVLPLVRPSLVYGTAVALLLGLGQFTAPLLLGTQRNIDVLSTRVYRFAGMPPTDYAAAAAIATPLLVVGLLAVVVQRASLANGQRFVSDAGGKGTGRQGSTSITAAVVIAVFSVVSVALPLAALVAASLSPFWTGQLRPSLWTLANFERVFQDSQLVNGMQTSLITSTTAVAIAIPLGYLVTEIVHRRRGGRFVRGGADLLVGLPLGVPAVVFGAGFLFTYTRPPLVLYGTNWVLILVYVTLMLPYTVRLQMAARMSLGDSYEAAARVSGAGVLRTHLGIILPMMRGAIGGAAALMFVLLSHEFTASLLVRSTRTQVLGTVLYDYWTNTSYPLVAAIALVMFGITAVGVVLAVLVGGRSNTVERL
ncbi:iron ABC transporter permease [Phycicoccus sp. DTK01]|uniref:ABC transporter permease n=1 Tax=Phycicoccus sp. DTK01 TaxID=2785745 RepID=UPI001A8F50BD|nr:ABC transporter permease subunit [Phycicoccus sp. DTK01]GIL34118.1 ABC transporter permease [Phycicoccus sp. DTK01]